MRSSNYVFIYNGRGADTDSVEDLEKLFSTDTIFASRPDVIPSDFNFNAEGVTKPNSLTRPTFVLPGGSAIFMGNTVKPLMADIKSKIGDNFNFVGVCAGAFAGTHDADVFKIRDFSNKLVINKINPPQFYFTSSSTEANINVISDFKAIGPFYPIDPPELTKEYTPFRVSLALTESSKKLSQLYIEGPGFSAPTPSTSTEVMATYADAPCYTFFYKQKAHMKHISQLPAMLRQRANEKQGGRFLSGTHIEACVPNSKMLAWFETDRDKSAALNPDDYKQLQNEQAETREIVESMLRDTFKI